MGSTAGPVTGNLFFTLWIIDYCNFSHYSMESSSISIVWLLTLLTNSYNLEHCAGGAEVLCLLPIFPSAMNLTRTNLSFLASQFIAGQYCGRLLKFSAHSLNVLGIRYKVFKYVFLLIISYIHIYETIFQICFFYWWYHIYIYTRPYWDAISWDNSYMMIIWSTWPLKIPNT